ncbi:DUF1294 domain-containing protein [Pelotomaculum propionicicum]|uniref:DUF1294 domain-containing protein n=1 Tax=Pelotomaculum propionicicum TaxID=258475 RepID=A0A4Y7RSK8_9FIRM|nr:DUF1294 domain-containing protein [Pelotomaculum propionicicum]NLI14178.1 DUF1294 domain-containing protein [Peptococcaceae bacterium]TEB12014.1 hypothetical protein Pmgp_01170 [Pelotomaculum propionicicum]
MIIYIIAVNLAAFLMIWYDKVLARFGKYRIPESRLLLVALVGGSVGLYLGMHLFRHKTKKPLFIIGVPVIFIAQILIFRNFH